MFIMSSFNLYYSTTHEFLIKKFWNLPINEKLECSFSMTVTFCNYISTSYSCILQSLFINILMHGFVCPQSLIPLSVMAWLQLNEAEKKWFGLG